MHMGRAQIRETQPHPGLRLRCAQASIRATRKKEECMRTTATILTAAAMFAAFSVSAFAQQPQAMRVAGQVTGLDNGVVAVKDAKGEELKIHVPANLAVIAVSKGTMADVKPNSFVGVGATPQADGSQKA